MISFYPGPSQVYDQVPAYVKDAFDAGVLGMNHRSDECMALVNETQSLLRDRLSIPDDYHIYFVSSATECWEIIAQSLAVDGSFHVFNGAFGQKWFDYTQRISKHANPKSFDREELIPLSSLNPQAKDVICITQNETSNGTQVNLGALSQLRASFPKNLIAVDATSSMAGIELNFSLGDIWFASVQKCFGLPAGLAILISSPKAREKFLQINERDYYNSLTFIDEMMAKRQTPYTPNVLGIYLLMRSLKDRPSIRTTAKIIRGRFSKWIDFIEQSRFQHLIANADARSYTVIPIRGQELEITRIKASAKAAGFLLGEGYGELKKNTFRIANFPALKDTELNALRQVLARINV